MNYSKIYDQIIQRAKTRIPQGFVERHHIVPRCMGGTDDNENLVALYPEEHFVAHVLLVKIHPEQKGLIAAVNQMTRGHEGKRIKRKMYGWLKRRFSQYMREVQSGTGNSQFGTIWICDGSVSRKIDASEEIPSGWKRGRNKIQRKCVECGTNVEGLKKFCNSCLPKRKGHKFTEEQIQKIRDGIANKKRGVGRVDDAYGCNP